RQPPDEPGVDRPEGELSLRSAGALEDPLELRRREVGIGNQPGALPDQIDGQLRAALSRSPVLPHDRAPAWLAGPPVPDHRRLALIGDPDGGEVDRPDPSLVERLARGLDHARPDLLRVVLDPACARKVLPDLAVPATHRSQVVV